MSLHFLGLFLFHVNILLLPSHINMKKTRGGTGDQIKKGGRKIQKKRDARFRGTGTPTTT
jgi:hypothetical protein